MAFECLVGFDTNYTWDFSMTVFVIGFSKCGTSSIHARFAALGLSSVHHTCPVTNTPVALTMKRNIDSGEHPLNGLERYDAFTDLVYLTHDEHIEAFKFYQVFLTSIPDAKFILNTRDKDDWIESCADHSRLFERLKSVYGYQSEEQVRSHLSADWDHHIEKVVATIPAEQLLLFDVKKDVGREIDLFLGIKSDLPDRLPHENFTPSNLHRVLRRIIPASIRNLVPPAVKSKVAWMVRRR